MIRKQTVLTQVIRTQVTRTRWVALAVVVGLFLGSQAFADDRPPREVRLANYLSGKLFVGKFTVDGVDMTPKTETYVINSCEKLPTEDLYRFKAQIKYGSVDQEVPLDLKILWSGNTPVITLDSLWIPGMGTFDARVMIHGKRYAGSWQHGDKGGHMFGMIVDRQTAETEASKEGDGEKTKPNETTAADGGQ
ncbi:MAG: hypothetical protein AAFU85_11425 [Planctomycetota bacterium]